MWHRIRDLWHHNRLALISFVVVICLAGFFGQKSLRQFIYWSDPNHQDQPLADWMTPRYVAQSYTVPPAVVMDALDVTREGKPRRISLESLALENNTTLEDMQTRLDAAVAAWRAQNPRPPRP